jgi:hypothetical protein
MALRELKLVNTVNYNKRDYIKKDCMVRTFKNERGTLANYEKYGMETHGF